MDALFQWLYVVHLFLYIKFWVIQKVNVNFKLNITNLNKSIRMLQYFQYYILNSGLLVFYSMLFVSIVWTAHMVLFYIIWIQYDFAIVKKKWNFKLFLHILICVRVVVLYHVYQFDYKNSILLRKMSKPEEVSLIKLIKNAKFVIKY